ncbi:hypothetical protein MHM95_01580 [Pseudoalteromonas sp. CnMc7-15]|uniref:hypothetical protein n=1 Tax=unclassified Pseudoalteromonas TaxID=194690 RepID=UPI001EF5AB37|nr:hypothetical protein [Pseudoalteromonas sp. CnMc7-15]MCG7564986.1 hypothetical protein [Pseudoalteromonas sp. CnMc7-15]
MHNVMRIVAWGIVAFLYAQGLDVVLTLVRDAELNWIMTLTAIASFNLLTAHLITKYDNTLAILSALIISCLGIIVFGVMIQPLFVGLPYWLWVFSIVSLLLFVWLMPWISAKVANSSANERSSS